MVVFYWANLKATHNTSLGLSNIAPKANPTFTGTVNGIIKTMTCLANADNASDMSTLVSTATQAALKLKATATDIAKSFIGFASVETQAISINQEAPQLSSKYMKVTTTGIAKRLWGMEALITQSI